MSETPSDYAKVFINETKSLMNGRPGWKNSRPNSLAAIPKFETFPAGETPNNERSRPTDPHSI